MPTIREIIETSKKSRKFHRYTTGPKIVIFHTFPIIAPNPRTMLFNTYRDMDGGISQDVAFALDRNFACNLGTIDTQPTTHSSFKGARTLDTDVRQDQRKSSFKHFQSSTTSHLPILDPTCLKHTVACEPLLEPCVRTRQELRLHVENHRHPTNRLQSLLQCLNLKRKGPT